MQNLKNKIPGLIVFLILLTSQGAMSQDNENLLQKADSLFDQNLYTQSLTIYNQLYEERNSYTPQMLLKMAYILEGLGNHSKALYYLNIYYDKTLDKAVLAKMEELASQHKLSGYQLTDTDLLLSYYYKYLPIFVFLGLALCMGLCLVVVFNKKKGKKILFPGIALLLALLLIAYMNNIERKHKSGIVSNSATYLYTGPSSASGVLDVIEAGHKVSIIGKEDIWIRILWDGTPAYVRKNHLLVLGN